ncbi:MAG: hypothetical protein IT462_07535 [Planctomycetes bacterium]|nr:hypothetical protein [Planctomycetota bacterium]
MNSALLYLVTRTFANRTRFMVSRMREPRYLVPFVVFALYLGISFSGFIAPKSARTAQEFSRIDALMPLMLELGIFFLTCTSWFGAVSAGAPTFTESEATLLLQAPISRRRLVAFSMLRVQPQLIFISVFFGLMGARGGFAYFTIPATYLLFNFIVASRMAFVLLTARLSGVRFGAWIARLPAVLLACAGLANIGLAAQLVPDAISSPADFVEQIRAALNSSPLSDVMSPFRLMAAMPTATSPETFATAASFVVALIAAFWGLVWLLDSPWEEAAIARAQKVGRWVENFRAGRAMGLAPATEKAKRTPFKLAPAGPHWRAFAWKSITSLLRQTSSRTLVLVLTLLMPALAFGVSMAVGSNARGAWIAPLIVIGMIEIMLPMMGPALFPHDVRGELQRIDLLKSFPVPGRDIIRGGVWACTAYIAFYQAALLVIGVVLVNGPVRKPFPIIDRACLAAAVLPILTMVTALSFTLEGAGAVLMPSWLMPRPQAGVEAAGRNMLMAFIRLVGASLCILPVAAIAAPLGYLGYQFGGIGTLPIVGLITGGLLWAEVELLIHWSGARLTTLDPAQEAVS